MKITAITGGIGSGKSVVSEMLRVMGHNVYDCDLRAKSIMDADENIKKLLAEKIHPDVIDTEGNINRPRLAEIVFADPDKLSTLNSIVHSAVRADMKGWTESINADRAWVETAILYESGLDKLVDDIWEVTAPQELRIKRVMRRNAMTAAQVKARIDSQQSTDFQKHATPQSIHLIVNDDLQPLLPQVLALL